MSRATWLFMTLFSLAMLVALSFGAACGDDDDDDDDDSTLDDDTGDDDEDDASSGCDETATVLADQETESELLGFSADDLLFIAGGGFETTGTYLEDSDILSYTPSEGATEVTITINYTDGEIREIESVPSETTGEAPDIDAICENRLEVDAEIVVATADGAFFETWQGTLTQSETESVPTVSIDFDPSALDGDFEITAIEGPEPDSVEGALRTTFGDEPAGEIAILVEQSSGDGPDGTVSMAQIPVLTWGETF